MENLEAEYIKYRRWFRRFVAVMLGAIVFLGGYLLITAFTNVAPEDRGGYMPFVIAVITIIAWWGAQTDNRRAERENDKTLIVSSWWRDLTVVGLGVLAAAVVADFTTILPFGVVLGAGISALAGWLVMRHLWKRAPQRI